MRELRTFRATRATVTEGRQFTGQAAVFNTETPIGDPYRWGFFEQVAPTAFDSTIRDDDIVLLSDHDPAKPHARTSEGTLTLSTSDGLDVGCPEIPATSYGNDLVINLANRNVKGMSFGFEVRDDDWGTRSVRMPDGSSVTVDVRTLNEVRLFEVSTTAFPAYPTTSAGIRSALVRKVGAGQHVLSVRGYADAVALRDSILKEMREGKTLSGATVDALQEILDLIASADEAVDQAQPLLAGLMGVPNPDEDETGEDDENGPDATDADPNSEQERAVVPFYHRRLSALGAVTGLPVTSAA